MDTTGFYAKTVEELKTHGVLPEVIRTYAELEKVRDDFLIGLNGFKTPFLIVVSTPGLSKSFQFERITTGKYLNGVASAFGLYRLAFENQDVPLVLDDIDLLLADRAAVSLLKALANDRKVKTVCWTKRIPQSENLPQSFETQSRLCMLFNSIPVKNVNARAVLDRSRFVLFCPTVHEVHRYVKNWYSDTEIHDYIGERLHLIGVPSIRTYSKALNLKRHGNDWKFWLDSVFSETENKHFQLIGELIKTLPVGEARVKAWQDRTGLSRATFYRFQSIYMDNHETVRLQGIQHPVSESHEVQSV
jgi:hypothetical protein